MPEEKQKMFAYTGADVTVPAAVFTTSLSGWLHRNRYNAARPASVAYDHLVVDDQWGQFRILHEAYFMVEESGDVQIIMPMRRLVIDPGMKILEPVTEATAIHAVSQVQKLGLFANIEWKRVK